MNRRTLHAVQLPLLIELEERAQERVKRVEAATPMLGVGSVIDADLITAMREYQDALVWRDELRNELQERGWYDPTPLTADQRG